MTMHSALLKSFDRAMWAFLKIIRIQSSLGPLQSTYTPDIFIYTYIYIYINVCVFIYLSLSLSFSLSLRSPWAICFENLPSVMVCLYSLPGPDPSQATFFNNGKSSRKSEKKKKKTTWKRWLPYVCGLIRVVVCREAITFVILKDILPALTPPFSK